MSGETEELTDYQIAQSAEMAPIWEVVEPVGVERSDLDLYEEHKAKLSHEAIDRLSSGRTGESMLVLVTGMTPAPRGEGETVTTVGLGQTLNHLGKPAVTAVREPSLGPVFGVEGGAAGGGYSQMLPMEDINLHFTGNIHALTATPNLVSTMLNSTLHHGDELHVDVNEVEWPRAIDMNDRALRETVIGLGGQSTGIPREDGFVLTAASELMAVLCLSEDLADRKARVARIIVAYDDDGGPITVDDIGATGGVTILLWDALKPNVVQTTEGTPALVHGGPFANIAHGTNSLIADRAVFGMGEYVGLG